MSEAQATQKPDRTMQEIQNEYTSVCNKVGHINYQISTSKRDLELLYSALRDLNFEAAALQAKQKQKADEEAAASAESSKVVQLKEVANA